MLLARARYPRRCQPARRGGAGRAPRRWLTAHFALASAGLGFKDVQVHDLPQANGAAGVFAGKIDAIQTYPPFAVELLNGGRRTPCLIPGRRRKVLDVLVIRRTC